MPKSLFNIVAGLRMQLYQKRTLAQVFSCAVTLLKKGSGTSVFLWLLSNFCCLLFHLCEAPFYRSPLADCFCFPLYLSQRYCLSIKVPLREVSKCFLWSVFNPSTGKYGPEKTPYLGTFHVVYIPAIKVFRIQNDIVVLKEIWNFHFSNAFCCRDFVPSGSSLNLTLKIKRFLVNL